MARVKGAMKGMRYFRTKGMAAKEVGVPMHPKRANTSPAIDRRVFSAQRAVLRRPCALCAHAAIGREQCHLSKTRCHMACCRQVD